MAIAYAGLVAGRHYADADWLAQARMDAHVTLGRRADAMEIIVQKLAQETPYPFRFWWKRVRSRMLRGEIAFRIYLDEIGNMREVHRQGYRLC